MRLLSKKTIYMDLFVKYMICSAAAAFLVCGKAYAETDMDKLYSEADSLDISYNAEDCYDDISRLHSEGVRVFDTDGLLDPEERAALEKKLDAAAEKTGFDIAVFTAEDINGNERTRDFAEDIYYLSDLGTGGDRSGTILVMETYGEGSMWLLTKGMAARYLTDSYIDYIYDEAYGGAYNSFLQGDYSEACDIYADCVVEAFDMGIQEDQYNYDTETGSYDRYYRPYGIDLYEIVIALFISAVIGLLPVLYVRRSYAMKNTNAASDGFNRAYRLGAVYNVQENDGGKFINRFVTVRPIPRPDPPRSGGSHGGGSFGGGSSMHSGHSGGGSFGGGGRGGR